MDGLVFAVFVPSEISEAVTVAVVLSVTLKVCVPAVSAALGGNVALMSVEVIPIVSVTVFTRFQFPSTALTVRAKAPPEI